MKISKVRSVNEKLRKQLNEMPQRTYTKAEIDLIPEVDRKSKRAIDPTVFKAKKVQLEKVLMYFNNNFSALQRYTIDHTMLGNVFKIDKTLNSKLKNQVVYFRGENINTEVNVYLFLREGKLIKNNKPIKAGIKSLLWRDEINSAKGDVFRFIFDYVLKDYNVLVSDSLYTTLGEKGLDNVIKSAFDKGMKVGVCVYKDQDSVEFDHYLLTYKDYIESKSKYFGDDVDYQDYQYFIER